MLTGAVIGVAVALAMMVMNARKARSGTGLPGEVEALLRARGPLVLHEIAAGVGKDSFMGRGQVAQALGALSQVGKVRTHPAPEGTPQLEKVKVIRYEAI